ncbi:radical SAM protein, partial [Pseudoxanthomonas sp. SGD-10]
MNTEHQIETILNNPQLDEQLRHIAQKVKEGKRIDFNEGVYLYENAELSYLGVLANFIRNKKHGDLTYFNRNFHIEPTNVCVYDCKFCSYSRMIKEREEGWEMDVDAMLEIVKRYDGEPVTEVHITGGVVPKQNLEFYAEFFRRCKAHRP